MAVVYHFPVAAPTASRTCPKMPRLYALENCKEIKVNEKLRYISLTESFRRNPRGGSEISQLTVLKELADKINLVPIEDRWKWSLNSSGDFSVSSIRKVIDINRITSSLSKTRWVKYVPIKVNVLAWKIKLDALPTRLNISRRGMDILCLDCPYCGSGVESSAHLFFKCAFVRRIASKISEWWNVPYADCNSYKEWSAWLVSLHLGVKSKLMFEGIFYTLWWFIWFYRNKLIFDANPPLKAMIYDNVAERHCTESSTPEGIAPKVANNYLTKEDDGKKMYSYLL
nr:RNA-directed DNA polymerase, eukaryota [Tanacetum cinerariifolium]